jgi:hypothetical protein
VSAEVCGAALAVDVSSSHTQSSELESVEDESVEGEPDPPALSWTAGADV